LPEAISQDELFFNAGDISALRRAGYLSPQGVPFRCETCDYYRRKGGFYGKCVNKAIMLLVEAYGCCNLWARDGVHG
jgi:hypothetical protein